MDYIVLNLKWNQPQAGQKRIMNPETLRGEIVQIGAVRVNEKLDVLDTFNVKVRPEYYGTSGMSSERGDVLSFAEAMEKFQAWCGDCPLITWGADHIYILEDNLMVHGLDMDWMPEVFDAQAIFDEQMSGRGQQAALNYAMVLLGMKPVTVRNALHGPLNMVKVLQNLSFSRGIDAQRYDCDYELVG